MTDRVWKLDLTTMTQRLHITDRTSVRTLYGLFANSHYTANRLDGKHQAGIGEGDAADAIGQEGEE